MLCLAYLKYCVHVAQRVISRIICQFITRCLCHASTRISPNYNSSIVIVNHQILLSANLQMVIAAADLAFPAVHLVVLARIRAGRRSHVVGVFA
jgi:hypothetical protein